VFVAWFNSFRPKGWEEKGRGNPSRGKKEKGKNKVPSNAQFQVCKNREEKGKLSALMAENSHGGRIGRGKRGKKAVCRCQKGKKRRGGAKVLISQFIGELGKTACPRTRPLRKQGRGEGGERNVGNLVGNIKKKGGENRNPRGGSQEG